MYKMRIQRLNTLIIACSFGADYKKATDLYHLEGDETPVSVSDILSDESFNNLV